MKDKIVFAFGRLNPPSSGHQLLIDTLIRTAKKVGGTAVLMLSRSNDKKKNPLTIEDKIRFIRKFFPEVTVIDDPNLKTPINAFSWLASNNVKEVYFVAGSDRLENYNDLVIRNRTRFDKVELISSGERDPDSNDASGMSASKLRGYVKVGDYAAFRKGMPKKATEKDARELFDLLQNIMNESLEEKLDFYLGEMINEEYI